MAKTSKDTALGARLKRFAPFYVMFAPVLIVLILFYYLPMLGIRYAFYEFTPFDPQKKFIGFQNFVNLFQTDGFWDAFRNTIILSFFNLVLSMVFSVGIALLINEINNTVWKKFVQTVIYLPHFLSWVVVASIFTLIFASDGLVNGIIGGNSNWLENEHAWRPIWYFINRWKETGWGTIIFLAAITGISPDLYEAAQIDGAGRLKQTWYITIPSLMNTILVVFILNLAKIMNVFESVFVLYNDLVYSVSDVIQTYTYRAMRDRMDYGYSTAVGLFKSVVSLVLVLGSNFVSAKIRGRGII
jgi:putative aldouronate transport system permease protein